jgi:hypothetical protein
VSAQCDSTRWNFPLLPAGPRNLSHHFRASCSPGSTTGGCPPPSRCHISGRTPLSNEEALFPQVLTALFGRVLRKKHAVVNGQKTGFCLSQSGTETVLFSMNYRQFCSSLGDELALDTAVRWGHETPIGGYAHLISSRRKRCGLISGHRLQRE